MNKIGQDAIDELNASVKYNMACKDAEFERAYQDDIKREMIDWADTNGTVEAFGESSDRSLERLGYLIAVGDFTAAQNEFMRISPLMRDYFRVHAIDRVKLKIERGEIEDILAEPSECLSAAKCNPDMVS